MSRPKSELLDPQDNCIANLPLDSAELQNVSGRPEDLSN